MLFSEGFSTAKFLSKKIVTLYQLATQQLSKQDHYDFTLRSIKSVLVAAGTFISFMVVVDNVQVVRCTNNCLKVHSSVQIPKCLKIWF